MDKTNPHLSRDIRRSENRYYAIEITCLFSVDFDNVCSCMITELESSVEKPFNSYVIDEGSKSGGKLLRLVFSAARPNTFRRLTFGQYTFS